MSDRRVIKRSRLGANVPTYQTIATGLLLDRLHSPGYVWGIVGTVFALLWIGAIIAIWRENEVDPFAKGGAS